MSSPAPRPAPPRVKAFANERAASPAGTRTCAQEKPAQATARYALITTVSVAMVAIISPILGAIADHSGSKKKFLATFASEQYPYGSNLVAWIGGVWKRWPVNAPVGGSGVTKIADLDRWVNGNETAVPLTLFDTAPMFAYIDAVHNGTDADMWDKATESDGKVKVIIRKRPCDEVLPKNPDHDDLRKDN